MKVRTGFVSNSSSSSFVICHKSNIDIKKYMLEKFTIPDTNIFAPVITDAINCTYDCIEKTFKSKQEVLDKYGYDESDDINPNSDIQRTLDAIDKGMVVQYGSFCSDSESIETLLCDIRLNYVSDDFIFIHEGDY